MANLKLRSTTSATDPGSTSAKGSALTHTEMDSNFLLLQADIDGKISAASPTITGATTIDDELRFNDSDDSNYITVKAPSTVGTNYTLTLPDSGGTSGYVLTTDGSGTLTWTAKTAGTTNLVDDTTPQLGGDLDVNGQSIVTTASGQIILAPDSGADTKIRSNVVQLGQTNTDVRLTTNGTGDLTLNTNDGTNSGSILIRDGANQDIDITPNGIGELDITSNIKQPNGKIIEQYGGQTGLFIHDQSEGGYTTSSFSTPGGMLAGPGIHIDSAGQFQFPSLVLRNNSVSGYPYIWAAKARPSGGTDYSTDAYMNNDEILFRFYGAPFKADATSGEEYFTAGADCNFKASENHSNGNLGCKIEMATINNGSTTTTTKLTINDDIQAHTAIRLDEVSAPTNVTDKGFIYAKDVTGTAEVFVMDAAGNETQISPHNAEGEWQYFSKNVKTGKTVRINMEAMIRDIEQLTGKTYIENE
jgi:hypothetical protein